VRIEGLRQAHQHEDNVGLGAVAHSLKGAALQVGARELAELCSKLQMSARQGDWEDAGRILREIEGSYAPLKDLLHDEQKRLAAEGRKEP
jgi:HPt (histidine-containing phosphotransfer) domain-containing protein